MLYALRLHLPNKYPVSMQFPGRRQSASDAPDNNRKLTASAGRSLPVVEAHVTCL
jgi:hypothetical protein